MQSNSYYQIHIISMRRDVLAEQTALYKQLMEVNSGPWLFQIFLGNSIKPAFCLQSIQMENWYCGQQIFQ